MTSINAQEANVMSASKNTRIKVTDENWHTKMRATKAQVKAGDAHVCSKQQCRAAGTPMKREAFYADKHQKAGLANWCKACEREYDNARDEACRVLGVSGRKDLTTPEEHATWDEIMSGTRSQRYRA